MTAPVDLRPDYLSTVHDIIAEHMPSASVRVFGSRATWTAKPHSDLDLIVKLDRPVSLAVANEMAEAFSESDLPMKVDIVYDAGKSTNFLTLVEKDAVPLPWPTRTLRSFVSQDRSICYGIVQPGAPDPAGRPVLRVNNFNGDGLDTTNVMRIAPAIEDQYGRSRLQGGELLVTLVGSVGLTAIVPHQLRGWNVARAVGVVPIDASEDVRWINHVLRSKAARDFMAMRSNTTVQTTFNLKDLAEIPIPMPPERIRQPMSELLSALEDKIKLNRQMNETLEASARALFRDWFVDFGPTRAKAEGRPAYLAPDLWSLFPDCLGDNDVPEGWEWESLLDQAHWVNGAAYKNMHFVDRHAGLPVIKIAELKAGVSDQTKFTNTDLGARYGINDGELLFSWSGNPDTSIDAFVWTGGAAWLNQHIFAVRENGKRTKVELFVLLKWLIPQFAEIARNKQTTGLGHVTKDDMKRLQVVLASKDVREAFSHCVAPIFNQILSNITESGTLAATRDALLPKLMSGELRVRDAEALAA